MTDSRQLTPRPTMASSSIASFGVDLGSEATFLVSSTADIVRNELGGHSSGSLVAFSGDERVIGEAAVGQASGNPKNTISQLHQLLGSTYDKFESLPLSKHLAFKRKADKDGKVNVEVNFGSESDKTLSSEPLVGMLLSKLKRLARTQLNTSGQGDDKTETCFAFGIPPWYSSVERRALQDAAVIGNMSSHTPVLLVESTQCLAKVLAKKHPVEEGGAPRDHLVIDVGASHVTMFTCRIHPDGFAPNGQNYEILTSTCDRSIGVANMDSLLYDLMQSKAQEKLTQFSNLAAPGSKAGARLLRGVDRMRRLLGTMPCADVTVENVAEDTDVRISVSRIELSEICKPIMDKLKLMMIETIGAHGTDFSSVEILGGGSRMLIVHEAIIEVMKNKELVFGQKLDGSAIAFGAALLMDSFLQTSKKDDTVADADTPPVPPTSEFANMSVDGTSGGLGESVLADLSKQEMEMFEADEVLFLIRAKKNEIESYILTMRSAPHQKHGDSINVAELEKILDEADNWSYSDEAYSADAATVSTKLDELKAQVETLCADYFLAVNTEKLAKESEMEAEAKRAEQEKFENGDDDSSKIDADNRRLTKAERMKKVMKHKETGTELFKDKNYVHAVKHYRDALTHCTKFFDLSGADQVEVRALKITLYLNLATCWTKLDNLDQVMTCAAAALKLDEYSPKALYRRAYVYEKRKEYQLARTDLKLARKQIAPGSESEGVIAVLLKKVENGMKKDKAAEKKMYGKMFS